jgi:hypothetical protein
MDQEGEINNTSINNLLPKGFQEHVQKVEK